MSFDGFTQELLPTSFEELEPDLPAAVAAVCASVPSVRAVYVCRVRREHVARGIAEELLKTAVEPVSPLGQTDRTPRAGMASLLEALPKAMQRGGISWLTEGGVLAWRQLAVCVFELA